MRRLPLPLPWLGVAARLGAFGVAGAESRLSAPMRRVHQSRCARALALELLGEAGVEATRIGKRPDGAPEWPAGCIGSLAHTEGHAVAAVAPRGACVALGIDVEPAEPLPDDAGERALTQDERAWIENGSATRPSAGRLVFGAKECVHKAIHPLRGAWLEFDEVRIEVDAAFDCFVPHPLSTAAVRAFDGLRAEGRVFFVEQQLVTVLALFELATSANLPPFSATRYDRSG